jgi:hypothetical protein
MSISIEGLMSGIQGEERALAQVKVEHNGQVYNWELFIPVGEDLTGYINASEAKVKVQIDAKEAEWEALDPKTRTINDPIMGEPQVVSIEKSEIVRPEIPDYYAKRRAEYPPLAEQLDAFWKGGQAQADMLAKIQAIKNKYPKPE